MVGSGSTCVEFQRRPPAASSSCRRWASPARRLPQKDVPVGQQHGWAVLHGVLITLRTYRQCGTERPFAGCGVVDGRIALAANGKDRAVGPQHGRPGLIQDWIGQGLECASGARPFPVSRVVNLRVGRVRRIARHKEVIVRVAVNGKHFAIGKQRQAFLVVHVGFGACSGFSPGHSLRVEQRGLAAHLVFEHEGAVVEHSTGPVANGTGREGGARRVQVDEEWGED